MAVGYIPLLCRCRSLDLRDCCSGTVFFCLHVCIGGGVVCRISCTLCSRSRVSKVACQRCYSSWLALSCWLKGQAYGLRLWRLGVLYRCLRRCSSGQLKAMLGVNHTVHLQLQNSCESMWIAGNCPSVTEIDPLILSRSSSHNSMHPNSFRACTGSTGL